MLYIAATAKDIPHVNNINNTYVILYVPRLAFGFRIEIGLKVQKDIVTLFIWRYENVTYCINIDLLHLECNK